MAGTFGAGESLTVDLNDGILVRVALTPLSPRRIVFEILEVFVYPSIIAAVLSLGVCLTAPRLLSPRL